MNLLLKEEKTTSKTSIFVNIKGRQCTKTEDEYRCDNCNKYTRLYNWQGTAGLWYCLPCLLRHFDNIDDD